MRMLNDLGAHWTPEVETSVLYTIATALKKSPLSLPRMSKEQLWASYKTARPLVELPDALGKTLTTGEHFALTFGSKFDCPVYPEGETLGEIMRNIEVLRYWMIHVGVLRPDPEDLKIIDEANLAYQKFQEALSNLSSAESFPCDLAAQPAEPRSVEELAAFQTVQDLLSDLSSAENFLCDVANGLR
jgi:hypothetical protein